MVIWAHQASDSSVASSVIGHHLEIEPCSIIIDDAWRDHCPKIEEVGIDCFDFRPDSLESLWLHLVVVQKLYANTSPCTAVKGDVAQRTCFKINQVCRYDIDNPCISKVVATSILKGIVL